MKSVLIKRGNVIKCGDIILRIIAREKILEYLRSFGYRIM